MMLGRLNEEKGIILPIVLILTLVLMITGLVFVSLGVQENRLVRKEIAKRQAFYLAEAGVEHLRVKLYAGENEPQISLTNLGNGDYKVDAVYVADPPYAISTGQITKGGQEIEKSIKVTLEKTHHPVFDYAVASGGGIKAEDPDTKITGDLYATGDIIIEAATVDGDTTATGSIQGTVTGEKTEGAGEIDFPEFDREYYENNADPVIDDNLIIQNESNYPIDGMLYVTGNVTISESTLFGPGTIVAEGTILVEEGSQVGTSIDTAVSLISAHYSVGEEDPAIKIEGNEANSSEIWGVLWTPNGNVKIEWSTLHGSVVSGDKHKIETGSGVTYIYEEFSASDGFLPSIYVVQRWEEQ